MACPPDDALEAHVAGRHVDLQIASHLDDCMACVRVVAALVTNTPSIGDMLGRYRLVKEIGRGGMGIVFAGHDVELGREVAIKVVRRGGAAVRELEARLRRESRLLARIRHPSVITIYDVGATDDKLFVAMELVRGTTLSRWKAAGPRSWREIVDVVRRAALGLAAAHDAGVLHRDVKPENILVEEHDGRVERVIVTDFGVGRHIDEPELPAGLSEVEAVPLTAAGEAPGTLAYMAPEQLDGKPIDVRADVFSLAVTAWELLFGRRPFVGHDRASLRAAIAAGPLANRDAKIPKRIERALKRALAEDPDRRTPAVDALARQLDTTSPRTWIAVGGGLALATSVFVVANSEPNSEPRECSFAAIDRVWPSRSATAGISGVDGLVRRIDTMAAAWRDQRRELCAAARQGRSTNVEQLDCLQRWARQLSAELDTIAPMAPAQPIVLADVSVCRSPAAGMLRLYVGNDLVQQRAIQQVRRRIRAIGFDQPNALRELDAAEPAIIATQLRGPRGELALFRQYARREIDESALRALATEAERDGDDAIAAHAWLDLALRMLADRPNAARARDLLAMADAAIQRLGDPADARAGWYGIEARAGALEGDVARVRRAAAAIERLAPTDRQPFTWAALALADIGDPKATLALLDPLVANMRGKPPRFKDVLLLTVYGSAAIDVGRGPRAREVLTDALAIATSHKADEPTITSIRIALARAHVAAGDPVRALAELDRARPILTSPNGVPSDAASYHELRGHVLDVLGHRAESLAEMRAAVAAWTSSPDTDPKKVAIARLNLAATLDENGDHTSALHIAERAVRDLSAAMGDANPYCASGYATVGDILTKLGRPRDARAAFERSLAIYATVPANPGYVAFAKRGLARVLPPIERRRAVTLAEEALAVWRDTPGPWRNEIVATEAWLTRARAKTQ